MPSKKSNIFCIPTKKAEPFICKWCLVLLIAAAFAGCTVYQVDVNADLKIQNEDKIPAGTSFFVLQNPESGDVALHESLRSRIETLLQKNGYTLSGADTAEGFLLFDCGTGSGRRVSGVLPGDPQGKAEKWPGAAIQVDYPRLVQGRWLIMIAIDAAEYRKSGRVKPIWLGDATSSGADRAFDEVIGFLLEDTFKYFGRDTDGEVLTEAVEKNKIKPIGPTTLD